MKIIQTAGFFLLMVWLSLPTTIFAQNGEVATGDELQPVFTSDVSGIVALTVTVFGIAVIGLFIRKS